MDDTTQLERCEAELAAAGQLIDDLREELQRRQADCDTLRRNFEALRTKHEQQDITARRYEELIQQWRSQLEEKEKEFDELQRTVLPRELQKMRINIIEEVEVPHKQQIASLQADVARFRDTYASLRREHELLLTTHEQDALEHDRVLRELKHCSQEQINALQRKVTALEAQIAQADTNDTIRQLQRENTDLKVRFDKLMAELREVRAEKESARIDKEHASLIHAQQLSEESSRTKELFVERQALSRKITKLEEQLAEASRANDKLQNELLAAERARWVQRSNADKDSQKLSAELELAHTRNEQLMQELTATRLQHQRHVEDLTRFDVSSDEE